MQRPLIDVIAPARMPVQADTFLSMAHVSGKASGDLATVPDNGNDAIQSLDVAAARTTAEHRGPGPGVDCNSDWLTVSLPCFARRDPRDGIIALQTAATEERRTSQYPDERAQMRAHATYVKPVRLFLTRTHSSRDKPQIAFRPSAERLTTAQARIGRIGCHGVAGWMISSRVHRIKKRSTQSWDAP